MSKRIAFLSLYPRDTAPSQRFRVEQFLPHWRALGVEVDFYPFYSEEGYRILYGKGQTVKKVGQTLLGYLRRVGLMFRLSAYDTVFVQRSVTPLGPPLFEWLLAKVMGKKLIYDFDDAIWIADPESRPLVRALKFYPKVGMICGWAEAVVTGNDYLADFARRFTDRVRVIPTVVDTTDKYVSAHSPEPARLTVGWTGSHSTLRHLALVEPALAELQREYGNAITIIANQAPDLDRLDFNFVKWSPDDEIAQLDRIDIGIMPLYTDPWAEGKCGFKAIQFMAMGKPVVATPLGVNKVIIDDEKNGLLAQTDPEWIDHLRSLLTDASLRRDMGRAARERIVSTYSIRAVLPAWKKLFDHV